MTSDLALSCLRCGRPAQAEHHHREGPGPVGKGMGGTHDHVPTVPLCRSCHTGPDGVHSRRWTLEVREDMARGHRDGVVLFERPVALSDLREDPRYWSDVRLAVEYSDTESAVGVLRERQATICYVFFQRYGWAKEWYKRCAQMISDETGHHTHERRIYEGLKLFLAWQDDWEMMRQVGATVALAVAESADPEKAREEALTRRDQGERPTAIARALRGLADVRDERERHKCPNCGYEHLVKR